MKHNKQDIYGTDRHHEAPLHVAEKPEDMREGLDRWSKEMRRTRFHAILFSLTVLALVIFIGLALFFYYGQNNYPELADPPEEAAPEVQKRPKRAAFDAGAEDTLMTDELSGITDEASPAGGSMPISEKWIKQAAIHLTQAEKAARSGNLDAALDHYQRCMRIFPDIKGIHRHTGLIYLKQEKFERASVAFEMALLEEPASFRLANNLGVAYLRLDKEADAEKLFHYALKKSQDYTPALYNLAKLYMQQDLYDKALPYLKRHLDIESDNPRASFAYAYVLIRLEQWEESSVVLYELSKENPHSPPVFFRLAQALTYIENEEDAVRALERGSALVDAENALDWIHKTEVLEPLKNHPRFQALMMTLDKDEDV
jgi:tetratricopeptide (TPR) repeat protein